MDNEMAFSSVFKIEEKPILRPCLSDDKRGEMRRIKAKAMEIERRVAEKKRSPIIQCHQNTIGSITIEDGSIHSENNTDNDFDNDNLAASISEWDVSTILGDASDQENRTVACSEILETVDSNADDASDQCDNTFVDTPLPQSVIRSDSFIVDEPSKCFLKHLEDNGVTPNTSFTSLTDLSIKSEMSQKKFPTTQAAKRKTECKKITTPKLKKHPPKLFGIKKRHPTDNISNLPESIMRKSLSKTVNVAMKEKPMMKAIPSVYQTRRQLLSPSESTLAKTLHDQERSNQTMAIEDRNSEIIANIEEKYRTEIVLFLEKQKREQDAFLRKVMTEIKAKQDAFQRTLIMQLKAMIDGSVSKINRSNLLDIINNANAMSDLNGNVSVLDNSDDDGARIEMNKAATRINAWVRGYLTRRLLKTEHVQEITKIIRDSLYLIIDLHSEKIDNDCAADVQMKHNLLQQKRSNCDSLSDIFTSITIAERMSMIGFDRQMIKRRLLQNNVRNNNFEKESLHFDRDTSSRNNNVAKESLNLDRIASADSVENKLKKLKIVKLFADSIPGYEELVSSNQLQDF